MIVYMLLTLFLLSTKKSRMLSHAYTHAHTSPMWYFHIFAPLFNFNYIARKLK